ncbi:MAG: hypothetical protein ACI92E_002313, partial [Oceanicoccus sp.]
MQNGIGRAAHCDIKSHRVFKGVKVRDSIDS